MADKQYLSGEEYQELRHNRSPKVKKVTLSIRSLLFALAVVVLCAVSFGVGVAYQKHHTKAIVATTGTTAVGLNGNGGGFGSRRGSGSFGQVTAVSDTSITITNQRTTAPSTYSIDSSTTITDNGQTVAANDIKIGDTVLVTTSTSDTSLAARILVNPSFGGSGTPITPDSSGSSQTN